MERTYNPCDECPCGIDLRDGSGNDYACRICEFAKLRALGTVEELSALVRAWDEGHRIEPWVVCFRCDNRRSPTCLKCTRNAFAPCGVEKDDHFTRAEAEAAIGGGGDG